MKQHWQRLSERFNALSLRERGLVAAGLWVVVMFLAFTLLVEPQLIRYRSMIKRSNQIATDLASINTQLATLRSQSNDPDANNRAALQQTRAGIEALDAKLGAFGSSLVPPEKMQSFLESLLARNRNLELVKLRTLQPTSLVEKKTEAKPASKDATTSGTSEGTTNQNVPNIYKHGIEIQLAGSYNDLLAYLAEIERMPQRILWNRLVLTTGRYPRNVMTLTVYTLSLDKIWLVV